MCYDELKKRGPYCIPEICVVRGPPVADLLQEGRSNTAAVTLSYALALSLRTDRDRNARYFRFLQGCQVLLTYVESHFELH